MLAMPRAVIEGARICVGLAERSRIGPTVLRIDQREIAIDDDGQAEGLDTLLDHGAASDQDRLLHPEMASYYRREVEELHRALDEGDETHRTEARRSSARSSKPSF
jgi:hypothetical protein